MKEGIVALVVLQKDQSPIFLDALSDLQEITVLESAVTRGDPDPMQYVFRLRQQIAHEEEEFGNYVEELLCRPFLRLEIQNQGVQWLKSKIRIEEFKKSEAEATQVIADFAYKLFKENPKRNEFILAGPSSRVRVKIFEIPDGSTRATA